MSGGNENLHLEEKKRIQSLLRYNILDTAPEEQFDNITALAAYICQVPISLITLLDGKRQWFKSKLGVDVSETPQSWSFCQYADKSSYIYEIEDAKEEDLFKDTPLVTGEPYIRFYAGCPLISNDGYFMGTLCVIDRVPKKLSEEQRVALTMLSSLVVSLMEVRLQMAKTKRKSFLLQEKHKELKAIRLEAKNATKAKERFLSQMSHEMRTPMNAVLGLTHILLEENPKPEQLDTLKTLKLSAENLLGIINDVLDISVIDKGELTLHEVNFSLKDLLYEIKKSFKSQAEAKGIKLRANCDMDLPEALIGDNVRLAQILMNLVNNGIKFTEEGEVVVSVEVVSDNNKSVRVLFRIEDTGIGIPLDKQEHIFERFTKVYEEEDRKFGGAGLGLTISKKLVNMLGGKLELDSTVDKGSVFSFELDFDKEKDRTRPEVGIPIPKKKKQPYFSDFKDTKLLLAEDNETNRIVVQKFLLKWGIKPVVAVNGEEAVNCVKEEEFDIVLMDLQMPVMDGYSAIREIRSLKDERYKHLPIIVLTASISESVREKVYSIGASDYISKPFSPTDLNQKIARQLGEKINEKKKGEARPNKKDDKEGMVNYISMEELSEGDNEFFSKMIVSSITNLTRLKSEYTQLMLNQDEKKLAEVRHSMTPMIKLLKMARLRKEMIEGKNIIRNDKKSHINGHIELVNTLCTKYIDLLELKNKELLATLG